MKLVLLLTFVLSLSAFAGSSFKETLGLQLERDHQPVSSYKEARLFVYGHLYLEDSDNEFYIKDLYCNKVVSGSDVGPMLVPSPKKLNAEHVWPQSKFNKDLPLKIQKSDLFNIIPVDPRANASRSNHRFGYVASDSYQVKGCSAAKSSARKFEPADEVKGNIARIMFYFSTRYQLEISDIEEGILREWHQLDPVDAVEMDMNNRIHEIQGNRNPFVDFPSFVDSVSDF